MSPPLLAADRSQLLVVDLQERLVPAMAGGAEAWPRAGILVEAARRLDVPVAASEQYPKGLGPLVPELSDALGNAVRFEKIPFLLPCRPAAVGALAAIRRTGRHQLVLAGVEAHVCVLQTALEASDRGYDVFVATDAVASRAERSRRYGLPADGSLRRGARHGRDGPVRMAPAGGHGGLPVALSADPLTAIRG